MLGGARQIDIKEKATNLSPKALVAVLFLSSFFFNSFPHVNSIKDILFYIAVFTFIIFIQREKIELDIVSPLTPPIVLIILWSFITSITAYDVRNSFESLFSHLIKYIVLIVVVSNVFSSKRAIEWLIRVAVISTLIFSLGAIILFYVIPSGNWSTRLGFDSFAHNIICFSTNIAAVYSFYEFRSNNKSYRRWLIGSAMTVFVSTTLLTQSRGGLIALGAAFFFFFLFEKKIKVLLLIVLIIGGGLMISPVKDRFIEKNSVSNQNRLGALLYYVEVFKDHYFKGIGYAIDISKNEKIYANEAYFSKIPEVYRKPLYVISPHSMFLSISVRMGIVGLGLYIYLLLMFFYMDIKISVRGSCERIRNLARTIGAAMIIFLIGGIFEPVFIHQLDMIFFSIIAMNIAMWKISNREWGTKNLYLNG